MLLLLYAFFPFGVASPLGSGLHPRTNTTASLQCSVLSPDQKAWDFRCPFTIGGQTLSLFPDLGTDVTWVAGPDVPEANRTNYKVYTPTSGFTKDPNGTMDIGYSSGFHINGYFGTDVVNLGDFQPRGEFGVATQMINTDEGLHDGVLGLAYTAGGGKTMFDSFKDQLTLPVFTMAMSNNDMTIEFGAIDSQYQNQLHYSPQVDIAVFWGTHVSGYQVLGLNHTSIGWDSILDSGSVWTYVPRNVASDWLSKAPTANYYCTSDNPPLCAWVVDCNATLPDVSFDLGDTAITVHGPLLMGGSTIGAAGSDNCIPLLQGVDSGFILGVSVLMSSFVVLDVGASRIGFAQR